MTLVGFRPPTWRAGRTPIRSKQRTLLSAVNVDHDAGPRPCPNIARSRNHPRPPDHIRPTRARSAGEICQYPAWKIRWRMQDIMRLDDSRGIGGSQKGATTCTINRRPRRQCLIYTATIRLRFDGRSTAYRRSLRSQRRSPLAAVTLNCVFVQAAVQQPRTGRP